MTAPQIAAVAALAVTILAVYGRPLLNKISVPRLPGHSVGLMDHIRDVISIREYYHTPEVQRACNGLLEVLLEVQQK